MTNAFYDNAKASPYRGGFEICPRCVAVVPAAYRDRHDRECARRHGAVERLIELDRQEPPTGLEVDDVTEWPEGDPTA